VWWAMRTCHLCDSNAASASPLLLLLLLLLPLLPASPAPAAAAAAAVACFFFSIAASICPVTTNGTTLL